MRHLIHSSIIIACMTMFFACDDNTDTIGSSLISDVDNLIASADTFEVTSQTILADSVLSRTTTGYLGRIKDPETYDVVSCDFMTQFHTLENFSLIDEDLIVSRLDGKIIADSCEIRLYNTNNYGDSLTQLKLTAYEMDEPMREDTTYYSNFDPSAAGLLREDGIHQNVTFSLTDLSVSDSVRALKSHTPNIRIPLNKPYTDKEGNYFRYQVNSDSIANVNTSFAGTEEVLQTTRFGSDKTRLKQIAQDPNCTYLKTPAGLFTELTLPVEDIVDGHDNDTIVSAKISMHRVLNNHSSDYSLPVPSRLLMIPRDSLYSFFENNNITDNKLSYQTSYSTSTGYTFNNISGIIKAMNAARKSGNYSENWNKVVLVPVSITTSKLSSTETITRVTHEMTMTSTKLVGGEDNVNDPITISIIYGKFDGR